MNDKVVIHAGAFTADITIGGIVSGSVDIATMHRELGMAMMRARHKDGDNQTRIELDSITLQRA